MPVFGSYDVAARFARETSFGAFDTFPKFQWIGAVQNLDPTLSRNNLAIYSFDQRRDVRFYPQMHRTYDYRVVYHPQDINMLTYTIQSVNTTLAFEEDWTPQAGITADRRFYRFVGCRAARTRISWRVGQPIQIETDFMFRDTGGNVLGVQRDFPDTALISGAIEDSEITQDPFYFNENYIRIDPISSVGQAVTFADTTSTGRINVLEAELTINNRLDRESGFTIGDTRLANLPIGRREIDFRITRLFEDQNQVDQFVKGLGSHGTNFRMRFPFGPDLHLVLHNARWNPLTLPKDVRRDVLVYQYTGKAFQPQAGGTAITLASVGQTVT